MKKTEGRELPKSMAKKVVKNASPKKVVKKVAVKKAFKEEKPRIGFIKVDVKVYELHKEVQVQINGITPDELIEICLEMMTKGINDAKPKKKALAKKATVKKAK
jgi:hypothetical protein